MQYETLDWRTASTSGNCVEVAALPGGGVAVRDSKDRTGPVLTFTDREWAAFRDGMARGVFDTMS